jgi:hypothetical protein
MTLLLFIASQVFFFAALYYKRKATALSNGRSWPKDRARPG